VSGLETFAASLLAEGRLVAFALAVLIAEILWFALRARHSPVHRRSLPTLFAGTFIMAALYAVMTGASPLVAVAFLLASLGAHMTDMRIRLAETADQRPRMRGSSASRNPSPM
jgi:bacteriorhodopsin